MTPVSNNKHSTRKLKKRKKKRKRTNKKGSSKLNRDSSLVDFCFVAHVKA
jgi:hypothetical protein